MKDGWNPEVYLRYQAYRARPALDIMDQIPLEVVGPIVDLGCGPGNVTKLLKDKWPSHQVTGVDKSEAMLAKARAAHGEELITWQQGDIATWVPDNPHALVFSNAALHWVENHSQVIPQLMEAVKSGGWLAFQIPVTEESAYQVCIRETVRSAKWENKLAHVWMYKNPMAAEPLYDLLSPSSRSVDIWVTDYHHVLEEENPVVDWIIGSGLTPYLAVLDEAEQADFITEYSERVLAAYPKQADGKTLFLMKRVFALAQKT